MIDFYVLSTGLLYKSTIQQMLSIRSRIFLLVHFYIQTNKKENVLLVNNQVRPQTKVKMSVLVQYVKVKKIKEEYCTC